MNLNSAAKYYASMGWEIFPCKAGQKTPLTKNGVKDATNDIEQIREWWQRWPDANIALACGPGSGVAVVDVDVKGKSNGFDEIHSRGMSIPPTLEQLTPTNGMHYFYKWDESIRNKNNFIPGVDIRSHGYYVMLAPSIHPNGGVYKLNDTPSNESLSTYPEHFKPKQEALHAPMFIPEDAEMKAIEYLSRCDAAMEGAGGHDTLLGVATVVVQGYAIAPERAKGLMWEYYNPRCSPPWDRSKQSQVKDFERKIDEVVRRPVPKPFGWMLRDEENLKMAAKSIELMMAADAKKKDKLVIVERRVEVTDDADDLEYLLNPHGMVGEMFRWIEGTATCPQPLVNLGATLVAAGSLIGPKYGMGKTRSNLMAAGIADSSAGKNHGQDAIKELFIEAGVDHLIGGNDVTSDTAIHKILERSPSSQTLLMLDEFGHMLRNLSSGAKSNAHSGTVLPCLMKLYSSAHTKYIGKAKADEDTPEIFNPHVCVWATSTPKKTFDSLNEDQVEDGFIPRLLWFLSEKLVKYTGDKDIPVPSELREWISSVANKSIAINNDGDIRQAMNPKPHQVRVSEGALAIFNEYIEDVFQRRIKMHKNDDVMHAMWGKVGENANKVAMIMAVGENVDSPTVSPANMDYACRLVDFLTSTFIKRLRREVFADRSQREKIRLFEIIDKHGQRTGLGMPRQALTRKSQWLDSKKRNEIILDLTDAGMIEKVSIEGKDVFKAIVKE